MTIILIFLLILIFAITLYGNLAVASWLNGLKPFWIRVSGIAILISFIAFVIYHRFFYDSIDNTVYKDVDSMYFIIFFPIGLLDIFISIFTGKGTWKSISKKVKLTKKRYFYVNLFWTITLAISASAIIYLILDQEYGLLILPVITVIILGSSYLLGRFGLKRSTENLLRPSEVFLVSVMFIIILITVGS